MNLTRLVEKTFVARAIIAVLLILAGLVLLTVTTTEVIEGLALIIIGSVLLYLLYSKHKEAMARIGQDDTEQE